MEARSVTISGDPEETDRNFEVYTANGIVVDTLFVEIKQNYGSRQQIEAWLNKEALDDLITVLQFARLERFGNDEA